MAEETTKTEETKGGSSKIKLIGLIVIGVGLGLALGKFMLFKPAPAGTTVVIEAPSTTVFSRLDATTVALDAKSINLAAGHYAKVQVTVYMAPSGKAEKGKGGASDEMKDKLAKINADMIAYMSGKDLVEVSTPEFQQELRTFLMEEADVDYKGAVADIQISEFVTQ
jgi:flagellar basal body-associated protein FliL